MSARAGRLVLPVALLLVLTIAGAALAPATLLRIDVEDGRTVYLDLPDAEFRYRYRHSVYDAIVEERYRVDGNRLVQLEIRSTDRRALEYYGLPSEPRPEGDGFVMSGNPQPLERIDLQVLREQEQELATNAARFGLSRELGDSRVALRPERSFRAAAWRLASLNGAPASPARLA